MASQELSTRQLRARLADVLNDVSIHGRVTYVLNNGRRVAAVVPVLVAEQAEKASRSKR